MRIRATKPEFWRSERIASVSWDARLVLKGLESYVDDNGVGKHDTALIVGDVFPRDMLASPRDTVARVSEAIRSLSQAGLVWLYKIDGTHLLYVSFWESFQRIDKPGKGRLPRPDGTMDYNDSQIRESVASPRESVAPVTGEQGNRGTGQKAEDTPAPATPKRASEPVDFDEFWAAYPKRQDKGHARTAWVKAVRCADVSVILAAAISLAGDPNLPEPKFIPLAATWLNGERWEDGPLPSLHSRPTDRQADLMRSEMVKAKAADARAGQLKIGA